MRKLFTQGLVDKKKINCFRGKNEGKGTLHCFFVREEAAAAAAAFPWVTSKPLALPPNSEDIFTTGSGNLQNLHVNRTSQYLQHPPSFSQ